MLTSSWVRHAIKQIAVMVVGSALYALAIYLTSILNIPGADNVQLRPGVAIPILCGALFGPAAGFVTGFVGNLAVDQFLGWGFWFYWYIGNGIMGLAAGLFRHHRLPILGRRPFFWWSAVRPSVSCLAWRSPRSQNTG